MALWGKTDTEAAIPKFLKRGQVSAVRVTAGGTGYTNGATATFGAPGGGGVTATGTIRVTGGVITGVTITNPGAGYTSVPTITVAGGSGATLVAVIEKIAVPRAQIRFIDIAEASSAASKARGINTAGWVTVKSKIDSQGEERFNVDVLVALSATAVAAGDNDTDIGGAAFSITAQPTAETAEDGDTVTFSVTTSEANAGSFQWQVRTGDTGAYANLANGSGYAGVTTDELTITVAEAMNGNRYRVVCLNAAGNTSLNSAGVLLTVTEA